MDSRPKTVDNISRSLWSFKAAIQHDLQFCFLYRLNEISQQFVFSGSHSICGGLSV